MEQPSLRQLFQHHLPLSTTDLDAIWSTAILTVDANVLLDLYRYHPTTREKLLDTLAAFRGRLWLSHQAATEFFRNRHTVIASALREFDTADEQLGLLEQTLTTTVQRLRGVRPIPRELSETLDSEVRQRVDLARSSVREAKTAHPNYFAGDPVLDRVLELFDGALGPQPSAEDRLRLEGEASRRIQAKIPPGFLDASKDASHAAGDYILWSQILEHAKERQLPFLLVTAEQKEDWWEKIHGKRIGARLELVEESLSVAGQRVVLYERDHFLTEAASRYGLEIDKSVLRDVRALELWSRPSAAEEVDLEDLAQGIVERFANQLTDSDDTITSRIAETNASGYYLDDLQFLSIGPLDLEAARFPFHVHAHFAGEQHEDRVAYGTAITAKITGTLAFDGSEWEVVDYHLSAELDHDDDYEEQEHE